MTVEVHNSHSKTVNPLNKNFRLRIRLTGSQAAKLKKGVLHIMENCILGIEEKNDDHYFYKLKTNKSNKIRLLA